MSSSALILAFFGVFFVCLFIGVPITFSLGTSGVVMLALSNAKMSLLIKSMFSTFESYTLLAIFLFTMMGIIYQKSGLASLLVDALIPVVGRARGGLALVVVYASSIFGALTGSANATCVTFAKLLGPEMIKRNYPSDWTAALIASASPMGQLIPPSVTCVVLGVAMGISIGTLFMVDLAIGLLALVGLTLVVFVTVSRHSYGYSERRYTTMEKLRAIVRMLPLLTVPVVVLGGMYSGIFTATEAGAIGSFFSIILAVLYRRISLKNFYDIIIDSCSVTAMTMLLIGASYVISYTMSLSGINQYFIEFMTTISSHGAIYGLLFLLLILLVMGCFIDVIVLCIALAPTAAVALAPLGVNPYHVAAIFLIGNLIGIITPPVGVALFGASAALGERVERVSKHIFPFVVMYTVITILIILFPDLCLWLPRLLGMSLT